MKVANDSVKFQKVELFITEDGSHSLQVPELDETYHSSHGAIQESKHVFIKNGLIHWIEKNQEKELSIFEVGFGTGLNALLTALKADELDLNINYQSIELYPLANEITSQLNYVEQLSCSSRLFESLHTCLWEQTIGVSKYFTLQKTKAPFKEFKLNVKFDLIYFDAFAPSKQPEMWEYPIIENCYQMLNPNGVFVTYSAKGQLKRDLKKAGFTVESLPGPLGKFEMVRATRDEK